MTDRNSNGRSSYSRGNYGSGSSGSRSQSQYSRSGARSTSSSRGGDSRDIVPVRDRSRSSASSAAGSRRSAAQPSGGSYRRAAKESNKARRSASASTASQYASRYARHSSASPNSGRFSRGNDLERSAYLSQPVKKRSKAPFIILAILLVAAVAGAGTFIFIKTRPFEVTVNGQTMEVKFSTSFQDLHDQGYLTAEKGDFIAVDKSVITPGGGGMYKIYCNDQLLDPKEYKQRLHKDDMITEARGDDVMEEHSTHDDVTPYTTDIRSKRRDGDVYDASFGFWVCPGIDGHRITLVGETSGLTVISDESNEMVPRTWMWVGDQRYNYDKPYICLTYDDGPDPDDTLALLDILSEYDSHATFFALGDNVDEYPECAKAILDQGSQLATHTRDHEYFHQSIFDADEIRAEVTDGIASIKSATGYETTCMRPPGGYFAQQDVETLDGVITSCVGWDIDTNDYVKSRSVEQITQTCLNQAYPGAIILMHDGGGGDHRSVEATRAVLSALTAEGYVFVTVDELMYQVRVCLVDEGEFPASILDH
ncbi:MAG: polysaccharide deacetylase family protein [Coriobacteriales bacterium]|nr:polysaccharide deacetylase family protein [Coriobacteriales bacterium]